MGDLKASDTLRDAVYIYVTATGLAATGLSPTCNVRKLTDDTTQAGTVAEVGSGIYKMSRAVAAEAFYLAEWAVTGAYTIVGNYKLFKAGGGRVEDIHGYVDDLETRLTAARAGYLDELDFDLNARLGSPAGASLAADLLVLDNLVDDLEGRLTAARAGYLDNINQAGLLQVTAARAGYLDRLQGHLVTRIFWSDVDDVIDLPTDSSDVALPSVVLPDIAGTIVSVKAGIKIRMIENTNAGGTNGLNGAQNIQVKESLAGSFLTAINLTDNQWLVAASTREGGDVQEGDIDIVAQVAAFNKTYNFQIDNCDVDLANLRLNDVQTYLVVSYY